MAKRTLDRVRRQEGLLFDEKPIPIAGFILKARSVDVVGRPSLPDFAAALDFAIGCEEGSPYWIGALWNYGEGRADWREKLEQAIRSHSGHTHKTLINLGYIDRKVTAKAKALAPSIGHAAEVAALEPDEQIEWMDRASTEGLTVRDLRLELRASRRRKVIEGQATLEGMYRVIYADPPWPYGDRPPSGSGAAQHYPTMTLEDICKLPVEAHAMPHSVLALWVPAPHLENAFPVIKAWGFTYKTGAVWDKVLHGFGHYFEIHHEHLLIATRGSCTPDRPTPMIRSVQVERRSDVHSEKPASFRKILERLYDGPYLELFGREPVDGWTVFGNDARLWAREAAGQLVAGV